MKINERRSVKLKRNPFSDYANHQMLLTSFIISLSSLAQLLWSEVLSVAFSFKQEKKNDDWLLSIGLFFFSFCEKKKKKNYPTVVRFVEIFCVNIRVIIGHSKRREKRRNRRKKYKRQRKGQSECEWNKKEKTNTSHMKHTPWM